MIGTTDFNRLQQTSTDFNRLHPYGIMVTKHENEEDYEYLFRTLKDLVFKIHKVKFNPTILLADCSGAMNKNHQKRNSQKRERSQNQSKSHNMIYLQMLYQLLQRMFNLLPIKLTIKIYLYCLHQQHQLIRN
jgi:hypothetical protein